MKNSIRTCGYKTGVNTPMAEIEFCNRDVRTSGGNRRCPLRDRSGTPCSVVHCWCCRSSVRCVQVQLTSSHLRAYRCVRCVQVQLTSYHIRSYRCVHCVQVQLTSNHTRSNHCMRCAQVQRRTHHLRPRTMAAAKRIRKRTLQVKLSLSNMR